MSARSGIVVFTFMQRIALLHFEDSLVLDETEVTIEDLLDFLKNWFVLQTDCRLVGRADPASGTESLVFLEKPAEFSEFPVKFQQEVTGFVLAGKVVKTFWAFGDNL